MPDPIQNAAEQNSTEAVAPTEQKPPATAAEVKEQPAGRAVRAAANFFAKVNNLEPKEGEAKEEKKESKPAEQGKPEVAPEVTPEDKKEVPPEPVNPVFGKKKSKKAQAAEIKDAVAEGNRELVETLKAQQQKSPPAAEKPAEPTLSPKEARMVEQLQKLEQINPSYKDIATKFKEFKVKEAAYEAEWLKNHPDEDFDPDDDAHSKFYARHEPSIDEDDLEAAKEALIEERAEKKARERVEKEIEPIKAQQRHKEVVEKLAPKLTETFEKVAREAAAQINPEFSKIKDLTKVAEADPLAAEILGGVANHWLPVIQTAEYAYSGAEFNPDSAEGRRLGEVVTEIEEGLKSLPDEDRSRNGKQFATLEEYSKMTKAQQAKHWFIQAEDITNYAGYRMKLDAQKFYQDETSRVSKLAEKLGYVRSSGRQQATGTTQTQTEQPAREQFRPAPAVGGGSQAPAPSALKPDPTNNPRVNIAKKMGWA